MEKKAEGTGKKPMMTKFSVYNLDRNNTFDYSKAEQELGYRTRPYEETLRDEARWLMAEGKIKGTVSLKNDASGKQFLKDRLKKLIRMHTPVRRTAGA